MNTRINESMLHRFIRQVLLESEVDDYRAKGFEVFDTIPPHAADVNFKRWGYDQFSPELEAFLEEAVEADEKYRLADPALPQTQVPFYQAIPQDYIYRKSTNDPQAESKFVSDVGRLIRKFGPLGGDARQELIDFFKWGARRWEKKAVSMVHPKFRSVSPLGRHAQAGQPVMVMHRDPDDPDRVKASTSVMYPEKSYSDPSYVETGSFREQVKKLPKAWSITWLNNRGPKDTDTIMVIDGKKTTGKAKDSSSMIKQFLDTAVERGMPAHYVGVIRLGVANDANVTNKPYMSVYIDPDTWNFFVEDERAKR